VLVIVIVFEKPVISFTTTITITIGSPGVVEKLLISGSPPTGGGRWPDFHGSREAPGDLPETFLFSRGRSMMHRDPKKAGKF